MKQIQASVVIQRPRQVVFDFLLDLEHAIGIDPDIESVEKRTDGPTGPGTEFAVRQRVPPFGHMSDGVSKFIAVDAPRTLVIAAELGPIRPTARFEFKEADGGTLVSVAVDPNAVGIYRVLSPLIARRARRLWQERLSRLKSILESQ